MNIGIVTTWFERGAAYVSKQILESLMSSHNVSIYARGGESFAIGDPKWDKDNVTWGKKPLVNLASAVHVADFENWIRRNKLDIVLFNEQHWWRAVLTVRNLGVTVGTYIDYYTEEMVPCFNAYDFVICNTKRHLSVFENHPQPLYLPWGTDTSLFAPRPSTPSDNITFFHSAGMNPYRKGTDILLQAFERIGSGAKAIIHSQVNIKDFFPKLESVIEKMTAEGRLEIIDKTVTAPGLYHLGDVYVYPSRLDGIGLTLPEAISCGMAVIATDEAPMNEFFSPSFGRPIAITGIKKRGDGYYWPEVEPCVESLHSAMTKTLESKDDLLNQKDIAREYALKHLDWKKNSSELGDLINKVDRLNDDRVAEGIENIHRFESQAIWKREKYPRLFELVNMPRKIYTSIRRSSTE